MKFDLKEMYSYLLSHTFPGLLLLVEVLVFFKNTIYQKVPCADISDFLHDNAGISILAGYAFSTLLGTMLDGFQHFIFDVFIDSCKKNLWCTKIRFTPEWGRLSRRVYRSVIHRRQEYKRVAHEKYAAIQNSESDLECVKVYKHFIEDDLWYPYEAYANITMAMLLGSIFLSAVKLSFWFWLVYTIILISLCIEAVWTYTLFCDEQNEFFNIYSK